MADGSPTLEVGFEIDTGASFAAVDQLENGMDRATAQIVADAAKIEKATGGMVKLGGATAQIETFGNASTRSLRDLAREQMQAEKSGERMVTQLNRQIEVFGKSAAEVRQMRAEMRAVAAENQGLTELAARIRAASAEIDGLESGMGRSTMSAGAHRQAMMGASYQVQDFITQVSMGANPINAFAVQGAQLAGQFANVEGAAGKVARFFMGPWGLAITGALMLVGMLTKELFKGGNEADEAAKAIKSLAQEFDFAAMAADELVEVNKLLADQNREVERTAIGAANATRQKAEADRNAAKDALDLAQAELLRIEAFMTDPMFAEGAAAYGGYLEKAGATPAKIKELKEAIEGFDIVANRNAFNVEILTAGLDANEREVESLTTAVNGLREAYAATGDGRFLQSALQYQAQIEKLNDSKSTRSNRGEQRRLESLARENRAIESQIGNLYDLAEAYRVSTGAALIADARVKAESDAIKKRTDIEKMTERQIRLMTAERVADSAKGAAAIRQEAIAQAEINSLVASGLVPAERAASLLQERIEAIPLLAALEVAQQRGYADEIAKVNRALDDQRDAHRQLRASEAEGRFLTAQDSGKDRLAELREELRLVGATDAERVRALATLRATREAREFSPEDGAAHIAQQQEIAEAQIKLAQQQHDFNQELRFTADVLGEIDANARDAAQGMAAAFGPIGETMGKALTTLTGFHATDQRLRDQRDEQIRRAGYTEAAIARENHLFAIRSASLRVGAMGDMTTAARGFFKEETAGYKTLMAAEKAFRAVEFALSVRAVAQDAIETGASVANSGARAAADAVAAVAKAIASLPFPLNLAAGAATAAALASIGIAIAGSFGGSKRQEETNKGLGTVLGDSKAESQSIKRSLDALKEVDLLMLNTSRDMAASLRSIDRQIGGVASQVLRAGDVNADGSVVEGFKSNLLGSVLGAIPLVGGILSSLFGTKTTVTGSGLYGGPQTLGSILGGGFDASYYSDVQKTKKLFGITTSKKTSTQFTAADAGLEGQFTLILREFASAISAAADPLGLATDEVQRRLNSFVVNIGKIDLKGLTGEQVKEKLGAVFGAAADQMAKTAFPGMERFQRVGEGLFETVVRVASTVEQVTASLGMLGSATANLGIDAKLGLADEFESLGALSSATQTYFERFYTAQEQAAARMAQFGDVFTGLGLSMPTTLAGFRELVEAQNLNTAAGRETYAMLLQLAPAFADLQAALNGARSAADILAERADLERKLLEVQGDTLALRALDLAKLDPGNRALQEQIWALQDAQEAARAAEDLRKAWSDIGSSIEDEVRRIRGLSDGGGATTFASAMGQFNAATTAARSGDQEAARLLPGLSQALLKLAADNATSRQELDRVQAQTAASLEQTMKLVESFSVGSTPQTAEALMAAIGATQPQANNENGERSLVDLRAGLDLLRDEVAQMRADNNSGHAATAGNTAAIKRTLENVTAANGGEAVSVAA